MLRGQGRVQASARAAERDPGVQVIQLVGLADLKPLTPSLFAPSRCAPRGPSRKPLTSSH
jgi:hypothetical protein